MADSALSFAIYTGFGVLVAVVILVGALRFANAARKGNVRFRRKQRGASEQGTQGGSARTER